MTVRILYEQDGYRSMRKMESKSVDICCTRPPFQNTEMWKCEVYEGRENLTSVIHNVREDADTRLSAHRVLSYIDTFSIYHNVESGLMSEIHGYLKFIAPRIVEIHRLLKSKGVLYLHTFPAVSHYIRALCDIVFGVDNFHGEIIYTDSGIESDTKISRGRDTVLFYSKSDLFNVSSYIPDVKSSDYREEDKSLYELYSILISASSIQGHTVLDPFVDSAVILDAAEYNGCSWVGMSNSEELIENVLERMRSRYNLGQFVHIEMKQ